MSKTAAKKNESPLYGYNTMLEFSTEAQYKRRLAELKKKGEKVS